jgi:hypothetical protein
MFMKKIYAAFAFMIILALSFTGCGKSPAVDGSGGLPPATEPPTATTEPYAATTQPEPPATAAQAEPPAELLPPNVQIGYVTDEILNKYFSFHEYNSSGGGDTLVIWTDVAVREFEFIAISFDSADNEFSLFPEQVLYSVSELTPEKPFLAKASISSSIPSSGVSYYDEKNIKRYFAISESGMDGSLSLAEFNVNK